MGVSKMQNSKLDLPLKAGLLLAVISWFSYIFYDFNILLFNRHTTFPIIIEDTAIAWGLGFRMTAAAIAIIVVVFFVIRKEFSRLEATTGLRLIVLLEGLYALAFLGGALNVWKRDFFTVPRFLEQGIPCLFEGILIPIVLYKLFLALNPNKPRKNAVKWALIYIAVFILVFWLNNMGYWVGTVLIKGLDYIIQYPINLLSFVITVVGLLLLFLYIAVLSSRWVRTGSLNSLKLTRIGLTVTLLGLYPLFVFLLWLFFGSVGGWGQWYAWFLSHGHMTFIVLPVLLLSLPLLFRFGATNDSTKLGPERIVLTSGTKRIDSVLLLTQALGFAFFIVFSLAYYIPIPSTQILTGTEPFFSLLRILGTLFFVLSISLIVLSFKRHRFEKTIKSEVKQKRHK
jgi:hypothetical protein